MSKNIEKEYVVQAGPEAFLSPSAAMMGIELPDAGMGIAHGRAQNESETISAIAQKIAKASSLAICPGPLFMWDTAPNANDKAQALRELADASGAKILPMLDYSARRINVNAEISPNHPAATITANNIDVCVFAGVHSHYVNFALRLIRANTSCFTIVLGDIVAAEDAMLSIGNTSAEKIKSITEEVKKLK